MKIRGRYIVYKMHGTIVEIDQSNGIPSLVQDGPFFLLVYFIRTLRSIRFLDHVMIN
jgi:hypothetical protein